MGGRFHATKKQISFPNTQNVVKYESSNMLSPCTIDTPKLQLKHKKAVIELNN